MNTFVSHVDIMHCQVVISTCLFFFQITHLVSKEVILDIVQGKREFLSLCLMWKDQTMWEENTVSCRRKEECIAQVPALEATCRKKIPTLSKAVVLFSWAWKPNCGSQWILLLKPLLKTNLDEACDQCI